jgi:glycosyltransferase involved in cell wall biosynthesis
MRILHIIPSLAQETGGPAKSAIALCKALSMSGHEVTLYTTHWMPEGSRKSEVEKDIISENGYRLRIFRSRPYWLCRSLPASAELVRAVVDNWKDFDFINISSLWNPVATFTISSLRQAGAQYCIIPHGMLEPVSLKRSHWKKALWARLWEWENVEKAALIHFTTIAEEQKARQTGWPLRRTVVLPHFVDSDEWKELPPRAAFEERFPQVNGRQVILFVGRIHPIKNLDKLIDSIIFIKKALPNVMLVCAGPDSNGYQAKLEKQAASLGIRDHLWFTGMLEGEDLKSAYARADVFALVSEMESFGMAAAEALACGVPSVLSEGVNLGAELPSGGPISRVPAEPEAIAKALANMLKRSEMKGLPDREALALAEEKFGNKNVLPLIDAYEAAIRSKIA